MSPFGIFLIVYVISLFFNKKENHKIISLAFITIFVESFIYYSYFFTVYGIMVRYHEFLLLILLIYMLIYLINQKINLKLAIYGLLLLGIIILSNITLIISPLNNLVISYGQSWNDFFYSSRLNLPLFSLQTVLMSLRVFIFVIVSISLISFKDINVLNRISDKFLKYGTFIIIYGFLEFLMKNLFRSDVLYTINTFVFGAEGNPYIVRGGFVAIRGLMIEPAHFCESLFYYSIILIISNKPSISRALCSYKIRKSIIYIHSPFRYAYL